MNFTGRFDALEKAGERCRRTHEVMRGSLFDCQNNSVKAVLRSTIEDALNERDDPPSDRHRLVHLAHRGCPGSAGRSSQEAWQIRRIIELNLAKHE